MISAYYKRLTDADDAVSLPAALAWSTWESSTSRLLPDEKDRSKADNDLVWARSARVIRGHALLRRHVHRAFARIECHYFINEESLKRCLLISEKLDLTRRA